MLEVDFAGNMTVRFELFLSVDFICLHNPVKPRQRPTNVGQWAALSECNPEDSLQGLDKQLSRTSPSILPESVPSPS